MQEYPRSQLKKSCIVCSSNNSNPLYKGLLKCQSCGYVWADLDLTPEDQESIYEDNYFFGGEYVDYFLEEKVLKKDFQRLLGILKNTAPAGGKLLEIGSAYGFFLEEAKTFYPDAMGVEINHSAAEHGRKNGNHVLSGDFLKIDLPQNNFDVIVCWNTIEHLPDPHLYMEKIISLLKPGGIFACTTVDIEALVPRIRKSKWRQIHPPSHVSYFSKKTFSQLLEKLGFDVLQIKSVGQTRTFENMIYGIFVLIYKKQWVYDFFKKIGLTKGQIYLNLFDIMFISAKYKGKTN